jgi:hypothetical protein
MTTNTRGFKMSENLKDQMVETEDLIEDCIYESFNNDDFKTECCDTTMYHSSIDIDAFIKEFQSRGRNVQLQAVLDLVGVKTFLELKEYFRGLL